MCIRSLLTVRSLLTAVFAAFAIASPAAAEYPDKPIRIMAPYAPGGNIDVTARIIADKLKDVLGVTVLVENKAGASGMIGSDVVARAAPDGYTLLLSANSLVVVPAIYGNAPYDWRTAFQPISHIQAVPGVVLVNPSSPIKSFAEFIKIGIDKPNSLTIADSGIGTTNHIIEVLLSAASGAQYTLVHYKGSGQATIDVIAGQVPAQIDQVNSALAHIKAGKLRALAVTADKRIPELPDVPTVKELGVKGLEDFTYSTYTGLFGPAKLPPAVLKKLNDAMVKVLTDPATVKRFADITAEARPSTPEELASWLDKEDKMVVPLIKKLGIKAE
ncbi:MAG: tripartite tricarboxylate transporter substrate binding protein [Alphaproteobacteria bacterium]|nr:MAG: tripartite tricarboxylate transporter substrate binding protein [Alphaproteobacteria bacterium]